MDGSIRITDGDAHWDFDRTFLTSDWRCIWGDGCKGIHDEPAPEIFEAAAEVAESGVYSDVSRAHTRVLDGSCIFFNRPDFPSGCVRESRKGATGPRRGVGLRRTRTSPNFELMTVPGMYHEESIEIGAEPGVVFDLVSDLGRMGEWSPENTGGQWLNGGNGAVGDQFNGLNRIGEREWSVVAEVTVADRGSEFQFVTGPAETPFVRWTYRIETHSAGTRLTEVWDVEVLPGTLQTFSEEQLAQRAEAVKASMQATLAGVKASAES
jgi:hypothetical protein